MASKGTNTSHEDPDALVDVDDVIAACREGQPKARRQLYKARHRQVFQLMVRMVGLQDAADLTQQVFLQLFRKIDQFAGRSQFDTWLYRLAANEALQHLRKVRRWKFQPLTHEPASQGHEDKREEQQELLDQALARIDPGVTVDLRAARGGRIVVSRDRRIVRDSRRHGGIANESSATGATTDSQGTWLGAVTMDCCEVRKLLSAYFDNEFPEESRVAVATHLAECSACAQELAGFEELSVMAGELSTPEPPAHIWSQIEEQLASNAAVEPAARQPRWSSMLPRVAAIAAVVLVAIGVGFVVQQTWIGHDGHDEMAADFGQYLDRFHQDPNQAQQFLLAKYQGRSVDAQEAANILGYRPAVATGMPAGFSLDDVHLMDMPCCKCVQCTCKRDDGKVLAIFEHDEKEPGWFGDRPITTARCGGKECSIVQLNDRLAVSWKQGNRHLTVVGASDLDEVAELVTWFSQIKSSDEPS